MSEEKPESSSYGLGGWLTSVVQSAKEKSSQAVDFLKRDLAEFQTETSRIISDYSSTVQDSLQGENAAGGRIQQGVTRLLDGFRGTDSLDAPTSSAQPTLDRFSSQVRAIQVDPQTYLSPASGAEERFEMWRISCVLDDKKAEISQMLVDRPEVRALYTKLVPGNVSHADFWHRYFYKIHQLEQDEARRQMLVKRAEMAQQDFSDDDWDDIAGTSPVDGSLEAQVKSQFEAVKLTDASGSSESSDNKPTTDAAVDLKPDCSETVTTDHENTELTDVAAETTDVVAAVETVQSEVNSSADEINQAAENTTAQRSKSKDSEEDDLADDWDDDLDIEITEEDMKLAEEAAEKVASGETIDDDWENWD